MKESVEAIVDALQAYTITREEAVAALVVLMTQEEPAPRSALALQFMEPVIVGGWGSVEEQVDKSFAYADQFIAKSEEASDGEKS